MQDFFHHQYVKFHIRKLYRVGSSFSTNWWISRKRDSLSPLDSRKIVRILRFTTLRLERENISHLSRESRKIIDSKVPASKGICDRSQEGQISGQGIFLAINFIFWYCWWKIPANQSDMVNITMIYRVFFHHPNGFLALGISEASTSYDADRLIWLKVSSWNMMKKIAAQVDSCLPLSYW